MPAQGSNGLQTITRSAGRKLLWKREIGTLGPVTRNLDPGAEFVRAGHLPFSVTQRARRSGRNRPHGGIDSSGDRESPTEHLARASESRRRRRLRFPRHGNSMYRQPSAQGGACHRKLSSLWDCWSSSHSCPGGSRHRQGATVASATKIRCPQESRRGRQQRVVNPASAGQTSRVTPTSHGVTDRASDEPELSRTPQLQLDS